MRGLVAVLFLACSCGVEDADAVPPLPPEAAALRIANYWREAVFTVGYTRGDVHELAVDGLAVGAPSGVIIEDVIRVADGEQTTIDVRVVCGDDTIGPVLATSPRCGNTLNLDFGFDVVAVRYSATLDWYSRNK